MKIKASFTRRLQYLRLANKLAKRVSIDVTRSGEITSPTNLAGTRKEAVSPHFILEKGEEEHLTHTSKYLVTYVRYLANLMDI